MRFQALSYGKRLVDGAVPRGAEHRVLGHAPDFPKQLVPLCRPGELGLGIVGEGWLCRTWENRTLCYTIQLAPERLGDRPYWQARYVLFSGLVSPAAAWLALGNTVLEGHIESLQIPPTSPLAEHTLACLASGLPVRIRRGALTPDDLIHIATWCWHHLPPGLRGALSIGYGVGPGLDELPAIAVGFAPPGVALWDGRAWSVPSPLIGGLDYVRHPDIHQDVSPASTDFRKAAPIFALLGERARLHRSCEALLAWLAGDPSAPSDADLVPILRQPGFEERLWAACAQAPLEKTAALIFALRSVHERPAILRLRSHLASTARVIADVAVDNLEVLASLNRLDDGADWLPSSYEDLITQKLDEALSAGFLESRQKHWLNRNSIPRVIRIWLLRRQDMLPEWTRQWSLGSRAALERHLETAQHAMSTD